MKVSASPVFTFDPVGKLLGVMLPARQVKLMTMLSETLPAVSTPRRYHEMVAPDGNVYPGTVRFVVLSLTVMLWI